MTQKRSSGHPVVIALVRSNTRFLYQVLIAIALGIAIGYFYPHLGKELKRSATVYRADQDE